MKKIALGLLLFSSSFVSMTYAQEKTESADKTKKEEKDDKVDKLKIAYFNSELKLTEEEQAKFWPIYNECEAKLKELRKSSREIKKYVDENYETMSSEDAKKKMNEVFDNESKEVALKKEYAAKFSTVIGDKRALKLLSLEHEFKKDLLEALKDEHHGPGGDRPPHPPHQRPNGGR